MQLMYLQLGSDFIPINLIIFLVYFMKMSECLPLEICERRVASRFWVFSCCLGYFSNFSAVILNHVLRIYLIDIERKYFVQIKIF